MKIGIKARCYSKIKFCKNQVEANKLKHLNKKLTESSGEYNTVEACKTGDNLVIISDACEAVNRNF